MRFGCVNDNRVVGPWVLLHNNAWKVPAWVRKGPEGFRNMINDEVAYVTLGGNVPYGNFGAFGPDGMTEISGHVWGESNGCVTIEEHFSRIKKDLDEDLLSLGWIVDGVYLKKTPWWKFWRCYELCRIE